MILVKPSFEILGTVDGPQILRSIEAAGRTCYKSEGRITEDSAEKFVRMILQRGHESVLEHEKISVRIVCDRGVSHEIVRHRLASYSQESTRYCDYAGQISFVIPPWVKMEPGVYDDYELRCHIDFAPDSASFKWCDAMFMAEIYYETLRVDGWRPEQARSVLPNSLKTEIVMTANLREWRHFFRLRTAPAAHPQMREIAIPMLHEFQRLVPVVFDDIEGAA